MSHDKGFLEPNSLYFLEALLLKATDGIVVIDINDNFTYVSPSAKRMFGYALDAPLDIKPASSTHPDDLPVVLGILQEIVADPSQTKTMNYRFLHADGNWLWIESTFTNYLMDPIIKGIVINFREITEQRRNEQLLARNEERYRQLVDNMDEGVVYVDNDDLVLYINKRCCDIYGYEPEELIGKVGNEYLIHPDDRHVIYEKNQNRIDGQIESYEIRGQKVSGETIWLKISGAPIRDKSGLVIGSVGIMKDITESKLAAEELQKSEEKYSKVFQSSPLAITLTRLSDGKMIEVNDAATKILGYSKEEMIGKTSLELGLYAHPEDRANMVRRLLQGEDKYSIESIYITKSGNEVTVNHFLDIVEYDNEKHILSVYEDITEKKAIRESLLIKDFALNSSLSAVGLADLEGNLFYANAAYKKMWGFTLDSEVLGRHISEFALSKAQVAEVVQCLSQGLSYLGEGISLRTDGSSFDVQIAANMVMNSNGRPICMMASFIDITDKKQAENELKLQYDISNTLSQTSNLRYAMSYLLDAACAFGDVDSGGVYLISESENSIDVITYKGMGNKFINKYSSLPIEGENAKIINKGKTFTLNYNNIYNADKPFQDYIEEGFTSVGVIPILNSGKVIGSINIASHKAWQISSKTLIGVENIAASLGGVIARLNAEQHLKDSESRFRMLFDSMVEGFALHEIICDSAGNPIDYKFIEVNPSFEKLTGLKAADIIGKSVLEVLPKTEPVWIETYGRVALTGEPVTFENYAQALQRHYRIVAFSSHPGQFAVLLEDITESKSLKEQLLAAQKMEAIGQLAGGVAHDFNNLLTVIMGYSEELLSSLSDNDLRKKSAQEIFNAGKRATVLTRQLLTFSRKQIIKPIVLDINTLVTNLHNMLLRLIGEHIKVETRLATELDHIKADPGQLEQIIVNLVVNARDAMPTGGNLIIETQNWYKESAGYLEGMELPAGRYVRLRISDTGCGMDSELCKRIFEPFFSTKAKNKGMGLGLSTVYGIVKQSGGFIQVSSEVGIGSIFTVLLPATDEVLETVQEQILNQELYGSGEHILIVEDEESVCLLIKQQIEKLGYQVSVMTESIDALKAIAFGMKPDLIITDVVMPDMNGKEMVDKIRDLIPDQMVLFMSGFTDNLIMQQGVQGDGIPFIQKPFTQLEIAYQIKKLLHSSFQAEIKPVTLLVVDDDEDIHLLLKRAAVKRGHKYTGVYSRDEAIKALSNNCYDVLIVDMHLGFVDGTEALQAIREAGFATPAILFSGALNNDNLESVRKLGVIAAFEKSSDNLSLFEFIEQLK